jgi:uncharacterized UPF0160 family protein
MDTQGLAEIAREYVKLISGALAIRSKSAPTEGMRHDPLAGAMAHLAMCLRKPDATAQEYMQAIQEASSWWGEWYDRAIRYEPLSIAAHKAALERGDWITALGEAMLGDTSYLVDLVAVKE